MVRRLALTRPVSSELARAELTHLSREPIDVVRARAQHEAYERTLVALGCRLVRLPAMDNRPDAVFVEDTAVVVDELAVLTRPGAASRRSEVASTERALARHRPLARIEAPGTLDGGDVLRVGRDLFVGRSSRSDESGREQLRELLAPHGYRVTDVDLGDCLHLKTAITRVGERLLLVQPAWVDIRPFAAYELLEVAPDEPFAANALWLGDRDVVVPAAFPATARRLTERGLTVHPVDVSEIAKAEGGVTCCSILVDWRHASTPAS